MDQVLAEKLSRALEGNDAAHFREVLAEMCKRKGVAEVAELTGIARPSLYNMLSENGNPAFESVMAILKACGLRMKVVIDKPNLSQYEIADQIHALVGILASPQARYGDEPPRRKK